MESFAGLGYGGLFLAATLLPLSSEVILGPLLPQDLDPV